MSSSLGTPMSKPIVSENLIFVNGDGKSTTAEQVITLLCQRLAVEGYVTPCYTQQVLEREKRFPTALPTLPYATAIPHADARCVKATGVAVAVLDRPVPFRAMESPDDSLDVRVVLLLAVAQAAQQTTMLQWICDILNRQELVDELASAKSPKAVMAVLEGLLKRNRQGVCEDVRDREGRSS
jgi:PTS system galactitol-specific IIA component